MVGMNILLKNKFNLILILKIVKLFDLIHTHTKFIKNLFEINKKKTFSKNPMVFNRIRNVFYV